MNVYDCSCLVCVYLNSIDLAKPKSGARIFFSHTSLPRPGLEPGSSDSEPSALTTGLLNKAIERARDTVDHAC